MWRRLGILGVFFLLLLAGTFTALQSGRANRTFKHRLENLLTHRAGQTVRLGGLSWGLFPPSVSLNDISVIPNDSELTSLHVRHMGATLSYWPTREGRLVLRDLHIEGIRGRIPVDLMSLSGADADTAKVAAKRRRRLPVYIKRFVIADASVTLSQGDNWVVLDSVNVSVTGKPRAMALTGVVNTAGR